MYGEARLLREVDEHNIGGALNVMRADSEFYWWHLKQLDEIEGLLDFVTSLMLHRLPPLVVAEHPDYSLLDDRDATIHAMPRTLSETDWEKYLDELTDGTVGPSEHGLQSAIAMPGAPGAAGHSQASAGRAAGRHCSRSQTGGSRPLPF